MILGASWTVSPKGKGWLRESIRGGTWPEQSGEDGDRADRLFRGCLTAPRYNDSQGWLDKLSKLCKVWRAQGF